MKQLTQDVTYQNILDYKIGMKMPDELTVLYSRLSKDDKEKNKEDDSNSITNQKKMLAKFAVDNNLSNPIFFTDDGISGTTFDRPDFQAALDLVDTGIVKNFVVKDMSRFGRDYVRVGFYTENVFPDMNVRFIAINDSVDSTMGENEIVPFKNILNEWYARDTSKKIKASLHAKGMAGEPMSCCPPYGYRKDPNNSKHWIIDEPSAEVVRKIFKYSMEGLGPRHIAKRLQEAKIEVPRIYAYNAGIRKYEQDLDPYDWGVPTIISILGRREYLGHTINFKTHRKSYKNPKIVYHDPSEYVVFENTHEPIVDEGVFERVQQIRNAGKRRHNSSGRVSLFSGLVYCADCKSKMIFSRGACLKPEQDYYCCSGFRVKKRRCESSHYVRRVVLEEMLLNYLQRITAFASEHEKAFMEKLQSRDADKFTREVASAKKSLNQSEKRIKELDNIIQRLYEDKVTGIINDDRFVKLSQGYEREQKDLMISTQSLQAQIAKNQESRNNVDKFLTRIRKYTNMTELTTGMLNELIERIEVHARDKRYTKGAQQVDVFFNYVGNIGWLDASSDPPPIKIQVESAEKG